MKSTLSSQTKIISLNISLGICAQHVLLVSYQLVPALFQAHSYLLFNFIRFSAFIHCFAKKLMNFITIFQIFRQFLHIMRSGYICNLIAPSPLFPLSACLMDRFLQTWNTTSILKLCAPSERTLLNDFTRDGHMTFGKITHQIFLMRFFQKI